MERCFRCGESGEDVLLADAISENEIVKVCDECLRIENLPVIKRPSTYQLKDSEKPYTVRQRLERMAGLESEDRKEASRIAKNLMDVTLDDLRKKKTTEEELEEKYELVKKREKPIKLVDNFHWTISIARKKKKLTRRQVADMLGESEIAIKMVENKELPDDSAKLIRKLEQFFGIKLRPQEVPENGTRTSEQEEIDKEKITIKREKPSVILKAEKENMDSITIGDLVEMKKQKQVFEIERLDKLKKEKGKIEAEDLIEEVKFDEVEEKKSEWKEDSEENMVGDDIEFL